MVRDRSEDGPPAEAASHRSTLKGRQWQLREDTIVQSARTLLEIKGYGNMTLDDVSELVGVSKPTLYKHFASKEALTVRVLALDLAELNDQLALSAAAPSPGDAAREFVGWALDRHFGPSPHHEFWGTSTLFTHPEVQAAERAFIAAFAVLVTRAQKAGAVRNDVSADIIARTFHSVLKGNVYRAACRKEGLEPENLKAGLKALLLGSA